MSKFLLVIFAIVFFVQIAIADEPDPVLAKAGDYVIKQSDFRRLTSYYTPDQRKYLNENPAQRVKLIRRMLEVRVIADIARKDNFDKSPDIKEQLQYVMDDFIARNYISKTALKDITISDQDVKEYYAANRDKFKTPEQVRARHIMIAASSKASVEEKEKAKGKIVGLRERLLKGEDFAKLAEEYSDDLETKKIGGDTNYFVRGKMVKPFEDAAFALKPGEISDVIETKYGYHIIKVTDHREAGTKSLDEVKESIREYLTTSRTNAKAAEFVEEVTKKAGMEIYEDKVKGIAPEDK